MNNYFDGIKTIEDAKKLYRKLALKLHPDQGGSEDEFKVFQNDFESFLKTFMQSAVNDWLKKNNKDFFDINAFSFAKIIKEIFELNLRIEVIGFWVYAFESFEYKDILKEKGFWFSKKHKAWVYSGTKKKSYASKYKLNDIKNKYGSSLLKEKEQLKQVAYV